MSQRNEQIEVLPKPSHEVYDGTLHGVMRYDSKELVYLHDIALSLRRIAKTLEIQLKK